MAGISIENFSGIAPVFDSRRLPDQLGQIASNVRFDGGDMAAELGVTALTGFIPVVGTIATTGDVGRLFHVESPSGDDFLYRYHGNASIRAVRNPTPGDQFWRVYHNDPANGFLHQVPSGDAGQRKRLGVIPPTAQAVLVGDTADTELTIASATATKPVLITTTTEHNLVTGDQVKLNVPSSAGMTQLHGLTLTVNKKSATEFELRNSDGTSYTAFVPAQGATATKLIDSAEYESRVYVYTHVNRFGEESAPSPTSEVVDVVAGQTAVTVKCTMVPDVLYEPVQTIRVYRSVTGTSATVFLFVGEFIPNIGSREGGTDFYLFTDDVDDLSLGEQLQSTEWTPPPDGMQGLVVAPNGYLVGFKGNEVWFSEPFQPHAWPERYRKALESKVVGLEIFGNTLVVVTADAPYLGYGTDPASVSLTRMPRRAACINPLGLVSSGDSVAFPSYDGFVAVSGDGGAQNLTQSVWTEKQWRTIASLITCAVFHDRCFYLFTSTTTHYRVEVGANGVIVTTLSAPAVSAAYFYPGGAAPVIVYAGAVAPQILFSGASLSATWRSKCFELPAAVSWSVGRLIADYTPTKDGVPTPGSATLTLIPGDLSAGPLMVADESTTPADGWSSQVVSLNEPFRLPALGSSRVWTLQLDFNDSAGRINKLAVATSMEELRSL